MKQFAIGFLLILLDFDLNFSRFSLNVLPDFVGYWLLLKGMEELKTANPRFEQPRPFAVGMVIYTAILWVGNLLGVSGGIVVTLLSLIAMAAHFYIAWVLVLALREVEQWREADLYGAVLHKRWKILLGLTAAVQLLRLLALVAPMDAVGMVVAVLVLLSIIWSFLFVLGWNRSGKLYEELLAAPAEKAQDEAMPEKDPVEERDVPEEAQEEPAEMAENADK